MNVDIAAASDDELDDIASLYGLMRGMGQPSWHFRISIDLLASSGKHGSLSVLPPLNGKKVYMLTGAGGSGASQATGRVTTSCTLPQKGDTVMGDDGSTFIVHDTIEQSSGLWFFMSVELTGGIAGHPSPKHGKPWKFAETIYPDGHFEHSKGTITGLTTFFVDMPTSSSRPYFNILANHPWMTQAVQSAPATAAAPPPPMYKGNLISQPPMALIGYRRTFSEDTNDWVYATNGQFDGTFHLPGHVDSPFTYLAAGSTYLQSAWAVTRKATSAASTGTDGKTYYLEQRFATGLGASLRVTSVSGHKFTVNGGVLGPGDTIVYGTIQHPELNTSLPGNCRYCGKTSKHAEVDLSRLCYTCTDEGR